MTDGDLAGPAVWALTPQGCDLARKIAGALQVQAYVPEKFRQGRHELGFSEFRAMLEARFADHTGHVFIAATGLVVRCIAPLLRGKLLDPAVVVMDQAGHFAISLVGGHAAGANALAERLAAIIGARAVITTATDVQGLPALDLLIRDLDLVPENQTELTRIAAHLLAGDVIQVFDPERRLWPTVSNLGHEALFMLVEQAHAWQSDRPGIWVSWQSGASCPGRLMLCPRCLVAGLGFHRGTEARELLSFIQEVFFENRLALGSLRTLATISSRSAEPGLRETADILGVNVLSYSTEQLAGVTPPTPSSTAARLIGTHSVCEAAAMLASANTTLLAPKVKARTMTLAVALAR